MTQILLGFGLGILTVLLLGGVVIIVKLIKDFKSFKPDIIGFKTDYENYINDHSRYDDEHFSGISKTFEETQQWVDTRFDELNRSLDSRFDKITSRLPKEVKAEK